MILPTPLPPSDQCGDTATHPPHPHGSGRCYGLDGLEDLPRGPLVQQLRAAHAIVRHLCHFMDDYTSTDTSPMVEAHAEHMHRIAGHTADLGSRPRPDRPVLDADRELPEGWDRLIGDAEGAVVAGWDSNGTFWAWDTTEAVADACWTALAHLMEVGRGDGSRVDPAALELVEAIQQADRARRG